MTSSQKSSAGTAHILIVSEHLLFRQSLALALGPQGQMQIEQAAGSADAISMIQDRPPAALVLDTQDDQEATLRFVERVARQLPQTRILVLGFPESEAVILSLLEAGATQYVSKDESLEDLREAIDLALRGETRCSPELAKAMFARLQELSRSRRRATPLDDAGLTERELQVMRLVAEGMANKQIAKQLCVSLHTIKNHVHRILEKLAVKSRVGAVRRGYSDGWLSPPGSSGQRSPSAPWSARS